MHQTTPIPPAVAAEATPQAVKSPRRWVWPVATVLALLSGIGIGVAGSSGSDDASAEVERLEAQAEELTAERDAAIEERDDALAAAEEVAVPDEPALAEEGPISGKVGDTVTVTQDGTDVGTMTVSKLETSTMPYDEYGSKPKNGVFLIFSVELAATANQMDVYEDDFYVTMSDGTRFDQGNDNSWDAIDLDDTLGYITLNAGEKTSGVLVFDVPEEHGTLAWAPNYEGGPVGAWTF